MISNEIEKIVHNFVFVLLRIRLLELLRDDMLINIIKGPNVGKNWYNCLYI